MFVFSRPIVVPLPPETFVSAPTPTARIPDPFTSAPSAALQRVQTLAYELGLVPAGHTGRAAAALVKQNESAFALLAFESAPKHHFWQRARMSAKKLWPGMTAEEVPQAELANGLGQTMTLAQRIAEIFAPYPTREYHCGGREQIERRALWRRVLVDALTDPAVALAQHLNTELADAQLLEMTEWWCGKSPTFETRFDRTFYAPRSGARFLLEWMLQGRGYEGSDPLQDPNNLPELPVLYEDDDMVVVNKPSRLSSVPGVRETVSAKMILEKRLGEVFVVHRLDLDTSGVLAFAKNKPALAHMNESFRSRVTKKDYIARLEGVVNEPSDVIDLPLALNWLDRPRQCMLAADGGGKASVTNIQVLETVETRSGAKTLVKLMPETGRTHQLRLHCALGLKCPIDGDPFYGRLGLLGETDATRLCLHAARLEFPHPKTGKTVVFEAAPEFPDF